MVISVVFALIPTRYLTSAQLSTGWTSSDIGDPAIPGNADSVGNIITMQSAGSGISSPDDSTSDQFHFAYRVASGDIDTIVCVTALQSASLTASAGLMIRETLSPGSKHAYVSVSAGQGSAFQWRPRSDGKTSNSNGPETAAPTWPRLVREGNVFRGYSSDDGTRWTLVRTATINMPADANVGLAVASRDPAITTTATFESPELGTPVPSLPPPWKAQDVGDPALAGKSTAGAAFVLSGAGADIWGTADQFQFMYQTVSGDQEVVARVANLEAVDAWSKAGVMIRAELEGPAAHASMFATGSNGWAFQRRLIPAGSSSHTAGNGGTAPGWVRLVREGDLFSAYWSSDRVQWTLVGTDAISMPATVYIGLAVTSHDAAALATATFTNVDVHPVMATNNPPTVMIASPVTGAAFLAPATIPIECSCCRSRRTRHPRGFLQRRLVGGLQCGTIQHRLERRSSRDLHVERHRDRQWRPNRYVAADHSDRWRRRADADESRICPGCRLRDRRHLVDRRTAAVDGRCDRPSSRYTEPG